MISRDVDPGAVLVEEHQLDRARRFVEAHKLLGSLSLEGQENVTQIVARMLTALDIELFLEEAGQERVKATYLAGETYEAVVIISRREPDGIEHGVCVVSRAEAEEILGQE